MENTMCDSVARRPSTKSKKSSLNNFSNIVHDKLTFWLQGLQMRLRNAFARAWSTEGFLYVTRYIYGNLSFFTSSCIKIKIFSCNSLLLWVQVHEMYNGINVILNMNTFLSRKWRNGEKCEIAASPGIDLCSSCHKMVNGSTCETCQAINHRRSRNRVVVGNCNQYYCVPDSSLSRLLRVSHGKHNVTVIE